MAEDGDKTEAEEGKDGVEELKGAHGRSGAEEAETKIRRVAAEVVRRGFMAAHFFRTLDVFRK